MNFPMSNEFHLAVRHLLAEKILFSARCCVLRITKPGGGQYETFSVDQYVDLLEIKYNRSSDPEALYSSAASHLLSGLESNRAAFLQPNPFLLRWSVIDTSGKTTFETDDIKPFDKRFDFAPWEEIIRADAENILARRRVKAERLAMEDSRNRETVARAGFSHG